jgi:hypothetical protein
VAALAQNGDGLRADQAGAADDDDFHGLPPLANDRNALEWVRMQVRKKSDPQRACIMRTREATNTKASLLNTSLARGVGTPNARPMQMSRICSVMVTRG